MTSSRIDYLRITLKPDGNPEPVCDKLGKLPLEHCLDTLRITLLLDTLMSKMEDCGRCRFYAHRFFYENINLKVPFAWDYAKQGVCLEMSGTGLDYFCEYLAGFGLDLRVWLGMVRTLCAKGYIFNVPRIDYALDNICKIGEPSVISIKRVITALENGEVCCHSRVWSDQGDDFNRMCSFASKRKRVRGVDIHGVTVQLGSRSSQKICRFYDKLAERKQKGIDVPDCSAWTRCEFEFHNGNALCVVNHFIDDDDFGNYIRGVALGFVRFVERTSDNVSRCVTRRWWRDFLNGATKQLKLSVKKPSRSAYVRFSRAFRRQWLPSFNVLLHEWGVVRTFNWLKNAIVEESVNGRVVFNDSLYNNLRDGVLQDDYYNGFERVLSCCDMSASDFVAVIQRNEEDYRRRCLKAGAYSGRV